MIMKCLYRWMYPRVYRARSGQIRVSFYTADGRLHDRACRWSRKHCALVVRFRGSLWIATRTPYLLNHI
jgi:hypothetical protein